MTYEYKCPCCGIKLVEDRFVVDRNVDLPMCSKCGIAMEKVFSVPIIPGDSQRGSKTQKDMDADKKHAGINEIARYSKVAKHDQLIGD